MIIDSQIPWVICCLSSQIPCLEVEINCKKNTGNSSLDTYLAGKILQAKLEFHALDEANSKKVITAVEITQNASNAFNSLILFILV